MVAQPLAHAGLCGRCEHARPVRSARGSVFLRCAMHDVDPRFAKYPRLPVAACPGFSPATSREPQGTPQGNEESQP